MNMKQGKRDNYHIFLPTSRKGLDCGTSYDYYPLLRVFKIPDVFAYYLISDITNGCLMGCDLGGIK